MRHCRQASGIAAKQQLVAAATAAATAAAAAAATITTTIIITILRGSAAKIGGSAASFFFFNQANKKHNARKHITFPEVSYTNTSTLVPPVKSSKGQKAKAVLTGSTYGTCGSTYGPSYVYLI